GTTNKIAAGEVIEKPASVVKELVENSMDSGASTISVEIRNGGINLIKISDNGCGIYEDDAVIAFERHATSKIRSADDLDGITSMGFRGEALSSIAAVASVQLVSRVADNNQGISVTIRGGRVEEVKPAGCPVGTTITVRDLFYNTPARFKFLKKDTTEAGYISDIISRLALGNPDISFRFTSNGTTALQTPGNSDQLSAIFSIYGREISKGVHPVNYTDAGIKLTGFVGKPELARSNRNQQSVFVNSRYVKNKTVASAIDAAYGTFLMKNKFAFAVLNLEMSPHLVDINVHPAKTEVKFASEQDIFKVVYSGIRNSLMTNSGIRTPYGSSETFVLNSEIKNDKDSGYKQEVIIHEKAEYPVKPPVNPSQRIYEASSKAVSEFAESKTHYESMTEIQGINNHEQLPNWSTSITPTSASKAYTACTPVTTTPVTTAPVAAVSAASYVTDASITSDTSDTSEAAIDDTIDATEAISAAAFEPLSFNYIGQAFSTFLILQDADSLILVDQHAAHERIIYEKLKTEWSKRNIPSQILLSGISIELTAQEKQLLKSENEFFSGFGFDYEDFGGNSILLRAVPANTQENAKTLFTELMDYLLSEGRKDRAQTSDEVLFRIACKAAVKANWKLDEQEIRQLLSDLRNIENPFTCPHGRPSMLRVTRHELEKIFKRII
ncbi:MAG: DNA mismatch repair endonuclease MutL, partial [Clostridiales bacterium]|nr:DNA mismatch repair endonuclease MutL [Clostridiales bacterium]